MKISQALLQAIHIDPNRVWSASKNIHGHSEDGQPVVLDMYCKITVMPGIQNQTEVEAYRAPDFESCLQMIKEAQEQAFLAKHCAS